jgi:hypothetical protein
MFLHKIPKLSNSATAPIILLPNVKAYVVALGLCLVSKTGFRISLARLVRLRTEKLEILGTSKKPIKRITLAGVNFLEY